MLSFGTSWRNAFPPATWVPAYKARWLPADLVAGVTLAAYGVPVSLAYASLAGVPPQVGVYGYLLGGLGYLLFGSSRHLAIGPTSAISLMVGASVAVMAQGDPTRHMQIATMAAFTVAVLFAIAWLLKLSVLVSFVSETILLGFKAGAALSIAVTQLPALFGVPGGGHNFIERVWLIVCQLHQLNPAVLGVGVVAIALLALGEKYLPGRPVALMVVALSIVAVPLIGLAKHGVETVGQIPPGLPSFSLPEVRLRDVDGLLALAGGILLLSYIESVSAAKVFAAKYNYPLDVRQELLGLGCANLAVAFGGGYPVAGGLSQSAVNEKAGARSSVALVFASITLGLCLMYLTGLLRNLPKAVLAAAVLMAVKGLIDIREMLWVRRVSKFEFSVVLVALVGVLLLGILNGVLLASLASLLLMLARETRPHVAFLGRIPGTGRFTDLARHPDNETIPGVLAFRVEADLVYFNVENIENDVLTRVAMEESAIRLVVCDLSTSPNVDLAGARMLGRLHDTLDKRGIRLRITEAHSSVRDVMRAVGLEEKVGRIDRFSSVSELIEAFLSAADGTEQQAQ